MSTRLATATLKLDVDNSDLDKAVRSTDEKTASLKQQMQGLGGSAKETSGGFLAMTGSLLTAEAIIGGVKMAFNAVKDAIVSVTLQAAAYGEEMKSASEKSGVHITKLAGLRLAAEQSEATFDDLTNGLRTLSKNMVEQPAMFDKLGVATKDADGKLRSVDEVFADIAEKFQKAPDGAGKTAAAMELMGKSGDKLIPTLNNGRDGLAEMQEKAELLGLAVGPEFGVAADEFGDQLGQLTLAGQGLGMTIGGKLLPPITSLIEGAVDVVVAMTQWLKANPAVLNSVVSLGKAIVTHIADTIAFVLPFAINHIKKLVDAFEVVAVLVGGDVQDAFLTASKALDSISQGATKFANKLHNDFDTAVATSTKKTETFGIELANLGPQSEKSATAIKKSMEEIAKAKDKWYLEGLKFHKATLDQQEEAERGAAATNKRIAEDFLAHHAALKKIQELAGVSMGEYSAKVVEDNKKDLDDWLDYRTKKWEDEQDLNQQGLDDFIEHLENQQKEHDEFVKAAHEELRDSAGAIFDDMLLKGENVFTSLGNLLKGGALSLGRAIFTDIVDALFGDIYAEFKKFFQETVKDLIHGALGGIGNTISNALGGLIPGLGGGGGGKIPGVAGGVGAGAGGGAGGGLGGLGSFLTNPWTIAVGAGILGVTAWIKSQAHHEANEIVKNIEDPFWQAWSEILPSDQPDVLAALPAAQAAMIGGNLKAMNDNYLSLVSEFRKGGSDEALVSDQSLANTQPHYKRITDALRSAVLSGGLIPQFKMGGWNERTQLAMLHPNEFVVPEHGALVMRGGGSGGSGAPTVNFYGDIYTTGADDLLGQVTHKLETNQGGVITRWQRALRIPQR